MTALDTGFFLRLLQGHPQAKTLWEALVEGEEGGLASGLTFVELRRLILKGVIPEDDGELAINAISEVCQVVWPNPSIGERAAHLSHGLALPLVDALILATAIEGGAKAIWTTDTHLLAYRSKTLTVVLL